MDTNDVEGNVAFSSWLKRFIIVNSYYMQQFKLNKKVFPARLHKEWQQIRMRFIAQRRG